MLSCACFNPVDIMVAWTGYGLLGVAGLIIGFVCLVGMLLAGMAVVGHVIRRWQGDDHVPGAGGTDEERLGLASFRWESEPD
ncbi:MULTISPECIES: hypothetical protein [Streptomyces]|uniref:hypothetical protein n=1 Tax=Streptomyces TaxID=1883 RepID=UPI0014883DB3|nr:MULTISPECIES: hypothetical protein [Streptomyces]